MAQITKIKLHSPIEAIDLLNKMDKLYSDKATLPLQDNRVFNIFVSGGDDAKARLERLIAGEKPKELDDDSD